MRPLIVLLVISTLALLPGCPATTGGAGGELGTMVDLTPYSLKDINGQPFAFAELQEAPVVVVSFWATWCKPCKTEMPVLQELHEAYGDKGLTIVSINIDEPQTVSGVLPYVKSHGYEFTVVLDTQSTVTQALNPRAAVPFTMILAKGKRIAMYEGFQVSEKPAMEELIKSHLGVDTQ